MITIGIMYDDLSIITKPITQIDTLQKDKILYILFKKDGKNIISLDSHDNYGIKVTEDYLQFVQFNDDDGAIRIFEYKNNECCRGDTKYRDKWIPSDFLRFTGGYVEPEQWKEAVEKFQKEMQ